MPPKTVFIIRHAEKPYDAEDASLTLAGRVRAAAYAAYLNHKLNPAFPEIEGIYAAANSKTSHRPVQTVKPLAAALGIEVDDQFADKDFAALGRFLLSDASVKGLVVLVCWHHEHIPALAAALDVEPPVERWPSSVYDQMWQIDFRNDRAGVTVHDVPLLHHDR